MNIPVSQPFGMLKGQCREPKVKLIKIILVGVNSNLYIDETGNSAASQNHDTFFPACNDTFV